MSAYGIQVLDLSVNAGQDLTGSQFHVVKLTDDKTVGLCTSADDLPFGVLQNAPRQGEVARVRVLGVTRLVAGEELIAGTEYGVNANATAEAKIAQGDVVMGQVIGGASFAGEFITATVNTLSLARLAFNTP